MPAQRGPAVAPRPISAAPRTISDWQAVAKDCLGEGSLAQADHGKTSGWAQKCTLVREVGPTRLSRLALDEQCFVLSCGYSCWVQAWVQKGLILTRKLLKMLIKFA